MQQSFLKVEGAVDFTGRGLKARYNLVAKMPYVDSRESYKEPRIWMTEFSAPADVETLSKTWSRFYFMAFSVDNEVVNDVEKGWVIKFRKDMLIFDEIQNFG